MDENFDMVVNMTTPLARGVFLEAKFLGQPQTLGQEIWPP